MLEPSAALFVYGTLRDPDIVEAVLGRQLRPGDALPATAPGFVAVPYPHRHYPALVRRPGGSAEGFVLLRLSPFEWDLLDAYEGAEYARGLLAVMIGEELHEAFAYLPTTTITPNAPLWTLAEWQARHKAPALAGERSAADALRAKLIAIRRH